MRSRVELSAERRIIQAGSENANSLSYCLAVPLEVDLCQTTPVGLPLRESASCGVKPTRSVVQRACAGRARYGDARASRGPFLLAFLAAALTKPIDRQLLYPVFSSHRIGIAITSSVITPAAHSATNHNSCLQVRDTRSISDTPRRAAPCREISSRRSQYRRGLPAPAPPRRRAGTTGCWDAWLPARS